MAAMAAILDFQSERPILSFESICLSAQEKMSEIDCPDGNNGSHLGVPKRTILGKFDLQVAPILLAKVRFN